MISVISINVLESNYVWLVIHNKTKQCLIVDPGTASPVVDFIVNQNLIPIAILTTHYHNDHIHGIKGIIENYADIKIIGSQLTYNALNSQFNPKNFISNETISTVTLAPFSLTIIKTPGHTADHACYYAPSYLFCGDLLFSGGCGRVANEQYQNMFLSLEKISTLPDETLICCGHNYLLNNLSFILSVFPNNEIAKQKYMQTIHHMNNHSTIKLSTLGEEKQYNPFLRCHLESIRRQLAIQHNLPSAFDAFMLLRKRKDNF